MKKTSYFDANASTPLHPQVIEAIENELSFGLSNPSSPHKEGQQARGRLDSARRSVATFFKVKPHEVIFTSSGTESLNFLIHSALSKSKGKILTSECEHSCVYELLKKNPQANFIKGVPTLEKVQEAFTEDTSLIVLMAVNNETGVKTDIEAIAQFALLKKIPFIVDGVALLGKEPVVFYEGVSAMGFSSHKIHAPPGLGCVIVHPSFKLVPFIVGGAQEFGLRGGTENMLAIRGFAKGIELLDDAIYKQLKELRDYFEHELLKLIPQAKINGQEFARSSNVSNVLFPDVDGETLLMRLDHAGIRCSLGSACTSGALEPSRVLLSMGLSYKEAKSSLRFSFSRLNTKEEIDLALPIIAELVG